MPSRLLSVFRPAEPDGGRKAAWCTARQHLRHNSASAMGDSRLRRAADAVPEEERAGGGAPRPPMTSDRNWPRDLDSLRLNDELLTLIKQQHGVV